MAMAVARKMRYAADLGNTLIARLDMDIPGPWLCSWPVGCCWAYGEEEKEMSKKKFLYKRKNPLWPTKG